MNDFMEIIKEERKIQGKNQKYMADLIKTTQQYYGQYEIGKRKISFESMVIIAKDLKISLDYIAGIKRSP